MKKSTWMKISAAALALLLTATLFSLPAVAGGEVKDYSGKYKFGTNGWREVGIGIGGVRHLPSSGGVVTKEYSGKFKFSTNGWRAMAIGIGGVRRLLSHDKYVIILTRPVWIPGFAPDHKPKTGN